MSTTTNIEDAMDTGNIDMQPLDDSSFSEDPLPDTADTEGVSEYEMSDDGTVVDEMLRLKRENMILEDENKTLKKKLQKAYDFMKRFTINGLNMLESFFAIYWGKNA